MMCRCPPENSCGIDLGYDFQSFYNQHYFTSVQLCIPAVAHFRKHTDDHIEKCLLLNFILHELLLSTTTLLATKNITSTNPYPLRKKYDFNF